MKIFMWGENENPAGLVNQRLDIDGKTYLVESATPMSKAYSPSFEVLGVSLELVEISPYSLASAGIEGGGKIA